MKQSAMKRITTCLLPILFLGSVLCSGSHAAESMAEVKELIANVKLANAKKYLKEKPGAPDALLGVNMVLESLQELRIYDEMLPYLQQRYEIYKGTPDVKAASLVNATASPIYSLLRRARKGDEAEAFKQQSLTDFRQFTPQLNAAYAQVEKAYAMPKAGDVMPNVAFSDLLTGQAQSLAAMKGHVVLLEFWVSNCDICKAQRLFVKESLEAFRPKGFQVFGFSQDEKPDVLLKYIQAEKIDWPQAWDIQPEHKWAQKLNLVGVPTNFLIDHTGKVAAVNLRDDALVKKIEELIAAAPSAEPVIGTPLAIGTPE